MKYQAGRFSPIRLPFTSFALILRPGNWENQDESSKRQMSSTFLTFYLSALPDIGFQSNSNSQLRETMQCCFTWITRLEWEDDLVKVAFLINVPHNMLNLKFFQQLLENLLNQYNFLFI